MGVGGAVYSGPLVGRGGGAVLTVAGSVIRLGRVSNSWLSQSGLADV